MRGKAAGTPREGGHSALPVPPGVGHSRVLVTHHLFILRSKGNDRITKLTETNSCGLR